MINRLKLGLLFFLISSICFTSCTQEARLPKASEVKALTQKVADWQIKTFEEMGKYRALPSKKHRENWQNRRRYHDLTWHCGALYAGMYQWSTIAGNDQYVEWLNSIGKRNNWQLYKRIYHADDHAVGQFYLSLYEYYDKSLMMEPTKARFDTIMTGDKADNLHWDWCDALFMAPPVWARLAKLTNEKKYLEYMDSQYHKTYNLLWDKEDQLFFRDASYFDQREKNGEKIFWARGNGWVFGGLALMIPDLPQDWAGKAFYIETFKEMAETLKKIQRKDGTWSSGLLGGEKAYPVVETSGTSFYTFGLAWGINNGILDKESYEPILLKAWQSLSNCVNKEGMLGYVQPVGAAPGESFKDYTEVYGSGAFLAAGTEVYKFLNKFYSDSSKKETVYTTFLKDGGWCWYQDPRAIINNGKLIIAGLSGQTGDVRIGVYDLASDRMDGEVVLHKELEVDDHDVPALYARPDGSILAVWAKHSREKLHYYRISSPDNYLEWGETKEFKHEYDHKSGVTYMNLYYLQDEDLLYNFFRDGLTFNPAFITSKDHGETWGNRTHFIANDVEGRQRPYTRYFRRDENTVGISYTDGHPRIYGNSLYYAEFKNGSFYNIDGTKIKDLSEGPLRTSEAEKIYTGSETKKKPEGCESVPNSAWTCAMATDADNFPHIGYSLYWTNSDHRYRIASWDGEKWNDKEIAYAGNCLYSWESSYTGLMAFDPVDPTQVYISTDVNPSTGEDTGGTHEIYSASIKKKSDFSKIKWKAITSNSENRNIRPIVVSGEGYKVLLWLSGPWHTYKNYNSDVLGVVLEKPE